VHTQKLVLSLLATVVAGCGGGGDSTAQDVTFTVGSTGMIAVGAGGPLGNGAMRPTSGLNG